MGNLQLGKDVLLLEMIPNYPAFLPAFSQQ